MENKLKQIMSNVLDIRVEEINDNTSPENVEKWDSLRHMNLIMAIEEDFDVEFTDEEISTFLNYKLIKLTLDEYK